LEREVRIASSAVEAKPRKRDIRPNESMIRPHFKRVSLLRMVSHRTEQNPVYKVLFRISPKGKLSARYSGEVASTVGFAVLV
jgi:hypothetical protein